MTEKAPQRTLTCKEGGAVTTKSGHGVKDKITPDSPMQMGVGLP